MINQITKYFAGLQIFNGQYTSKNNHIPSQTINSVNKVLRTFFKKFYILISKPVYSITNNTVKITIFYYTTREDAVRLKFLAVLLSKMLKSNVQLELVRLRYVYHDSDILAQFLGLNSHKSTYGQFKNILRRKITIQDANNNMASPITFVTGFKIKISGRLNRQRVVPKKTVKSTYKGAISANINNVVDQASFTGKNKKGAYTIRVWLSHGRTKRA